MASRSVRTWRQLAIWLHVITSVGWMTLAFTFCVLLTTSLTTDRQVVAVGATSMADLLDDRLLAPLANASAFTGFMLAAATPWGYFRHWWVLTKFVITLVQLYLGIFVLSTALEASSTAAAAGTTGPAGPLVLATIFMGGAIAFQAWVSIAKPWSTTRWGVDRRSAPPLASRGVFVATVCAGATSKSVALGHPAPVASLVVLATWLVRRRQTGSGASNPGTATA